MSEEMKQGMTRREVLKKGALFGGTLMWVAPVVQAVGMSPAMAQVVSEGNPCCLSVAITAVTLVTGDGDDDVRVDYTHYNCGTETLNHIFTNIELSGNNGATWGEPDWAEVTISGLFGDLEPGTQAADFKFFNLPPATYLVRLRGEYQCGGDTTVRPHDDPATTWYQYAETVTVPS